MKKKFLNIVFVLIFILCLVFSGCLQSFSPLKEYTTEYVIPRKFQIYVCGAVLHEGFVEVQEGVDCGYVISLAGVITQTVFPADPKLLINQSVKVLLLQYHNVDKTFACINLNGDVIRYRLLVEDVDADIINKIADYYDLHGKIVNKNLLKEILGDDYQDNYYKFFVDVDDYEKID